MISVKTYLLMTNKIENARPVPTFSNKGTYSKQLIAVWFSRNFD